VNDRECVDFLQWCLPQLGLRWAGFRKVRGTVCKRVGRRIRELRLSGPAAYRDYLATDADEWRRLDGFCRIPISRFYRDRGVFEAIGRTILPDLAARATARGDSAIRCWSAGCASGEEPYTLAILWHYRLRKTYPKTDLDIVATDADPVMLKRAADGCYAEGSLRELPVAYRQRAFVRRQGFLCLRPVLKARVRFERQDIRQTMPPGPFDLVLCRNLVFTYFDADSQQNTLRRITTRLAAGGYLVLGTHERLPTEMEAQYAIGSTLPIYRRLTC